MERVGRHACANKRFTVETAPLFRPILRRGAAAEKFYSRLGASSVKFSLPRERARDRTGTSSSTLSARMLSSVGPTRNSVFLLASKRRQSDMFIILQFQLFRLDYSVIIINTHALAVSG